MQYTEIQRHTEYIFRAALQKCGHLQDAEDLTQEVLLAALTCSGEIANVRQWMSAVLNNKYYDMLRRKYQLPTVSIALVSGAAEPYYEPQDEERLNAEQVRREVAYLAGKYREVIVRHYLYGEKVDEIALKLGIPKGTVLSRLSVGREQMKKGLDSMEYYENLSYEPERLEVSCNGREGLKGEPGSLVEGDLMKQNILIAAYQRPRTGVEIARALGIPTAYIERALEDLTVSQLMRRIGNRYVTDFMITAPEELERCLDAQIELTQALYPKLLFLVREFLESIRGEACVIRLTEEKRKKLEYYFILHLFSNALYQAVSEIIPFQEVHPVRPDGGNWIASGYRYPLQFDFEQYRVAKYSYAGDRRVSWEHVLGARRLELHIYDTQPDLNKYSHGPVPMSDGDLAKLLYVIQKEVPIEDTGLDAMLLLNIPHLIACGVLSGDQKRPEVALPLLSSEGYAALERICLEHTKKMALLFEERLPEYLPKMKIEIPGHLEGRVAGFRQYVWYSIPMIFMKRAVECGDFDAENAVPPMVLVVDGAIVKPFQELS
ncbi:MAG: RNA polymerase sigma factor [Lachnospiraceae bacterium]|nr:RNA polymerase sigma factor [Lachnospiraceae bacterium]